MSAFGVVIVVAFSAVALVVFAAVAVCDFRILRRSIKGELDTEDEEEWPEQE